MISTDKLSGQFIRIFCYSPGARIRNQNSTEY